MPLARLQSLSGLPYRTVSSSGPVRSTTSAGGLASRSVRRTIGERRYELRELGGRVGRDRQVGLAGKACLLGYPVPARPREVPQGDEDLPVHGSDPITAQGVDAHAFDPLSLAMQFAQSGRRSALPQGSTT